MVDNDLVGDWEAPEQFYQVIMVGGWVIDLDEGDYKLLAESIRDGGALYSGYDIYGAECLIRIPNISGVRQWNPVTGARYRKENDRERYG